MAILHRLDLRITTGQAGTEGPVCFCFNGHVMELEKRSGGTGAGEIFEGGFEINSFAHHLSLEGPEQGRWEIDEITVRFEEATGEPYEVRLGPVVLDGETCLELKHDRPLPSFDV